MLRNIINATLNYYIGRVNSTSKNDKLVVTFKTLKYDKTGINFLIEVYKNADDYDISYLNSMNVSNIVLIKSNGSIYLKDSRKLKRIVLGTYYGRRITSFQTTSTATDKSVIWKSSDISVAIVDANGVVIGKSSNVKEVGAGSATITVKSSNGKTATMTVTVEKDNSNVITPPSKKDNNMDDFDIMDDEPSKRSNPTKPSKPSGKNNNYNSKPVQIIILEKMMLKSKKRSLIIV